MSMRYKTKQQGFSVLELLIALTLGLVVVTGIVQLFVGNSKTYEVVTGQARLQENARYSFEFISQAARHAGFFGCAPEPEKYVRGLVGTWPTVPEYNMTAPVEGFESNGDGTWGPTDLLTLPRTEGATNLNVHLPGNGIDRNELDVGSDLLVFRSVRQPVARLDQVLQPDGDPVVRTPGGEPAFAANDVVVVSNCEQAALFKVTGVSTTADTTTLSHTTGLGQFDNADTVPTPTGDMLPATLSIISRSYGVESTISTMESTFFFIAPSTTLNNAGVNVNSLWQKRGAAAPIELVQGVDGMQVVYGIDTTADGVNDVSRYQTIDNVADLTQIIAVRVSLDITSVDNIVENNNQPLQRTFTKTINVRNSDA